MGYLRRIGMWQLAPVNIKNNKPSQQARYMG
jgi:hypothetical protein